jgi:hypothetical protein
MRGKPWSVDEERHLRQLLEEGRSLDEISIFMDKTRVSVKSKLFNSGLHLLEDAVQTIIRLVRAASCID